MKRLFIDRIFLNTFVGKFIQVWKEFEIKHGNEDTMREMLRIKRSVQATYNTQVNIVITNKESILYFTDVVLFISLKI